MRSRGTEAHRTPARNGLGAVLVALSLGACFGASVHKDRDSDDPQCRLDVDCPNGRICVDVDGNLNDTCEGFETCECAVVTPGSGGSVGVGGRVGLGGASGSESVGGSSVNGGSAGTGVAPSCERDTDCPEGRFCIDRVGDGDDFCEVGETCICAGPGNSGGGGTGSGGGGLGGGAGKGGAGNGGAAATSLGAPCSSSAECGASLVCLTSSGLADRSGPPGGLCTLPCASDDECLEQSPSAYCIGFDAGATYYCVEACRGGAVGAPKCHVRADFACGILDTTPTAVRCTSTDACSANQVCLDGVCQDMVTACRPTCGGNFDCASGQFCDFVSGFCVPTPPTGLPIGALCDPTLPPESDPCNGFCIATDDTGTEGTCSAFCSASVSTVGCGFSGEGPAPAGCLFATVISRDAAGGISLAESDLMLCGALCDCNADCPAASDYCMDENAGDAVASIQALFGRAGYCRALLQGETTADSIASCL